ncbi:MAG: alpha/beta hydrolase [Steroidobacteraceae bacterium]
MSVKLSRRVLLVSGMAAFSSACTQLAFLTANVPASFGDYSRTRDLAYGAMSRNKLDVYLPAKPQAAPVVVFFHGGGWNSGDKADYKFVGAALAEQGYIAVLPNYRLYPQVKFAGFMQDAAAAVAWVHMHAAEWGGDVRRLYLAGHSAGAHIAVMLALNEQYLQAAGMSAGDLRGVVGLAGPYDFLPFRYGYMNDLFGPADRYAQSQPINYVRATAPPLLLLQGMQDRTVAPGNTVNLTKALTATGASVTARYYQHADHGDLVAAFSIPARRRVPVLEALRQFIDASGRTPQ